MILRGQNVTKSRQYYTRHKKKYCEGAKNTSYVLMQSSREYSSKIHGFHGNGLIKIKNSIHDLKIR